MITYEPITQSSHIPHQFYHTEAYRDICNHGTLASFQPFISTIMITYKSITQSLHINSIILKHIETYVTVVP